MSTLPVLTSCTLRCASLIVFIYVLFQVPHPVDLNSVRAAVMLTAIEATAARRSNARLQAATFAPISVFDLFESLWEVEPALQLYSSVLQIFTGLQKDFSYSFFFTYANTTELWLRNQCTSQYFEEIQTYWFSNHTSAVINFSHLNFNIVMFFQRQRPCVVNIFGSI